MKIKIVSIFLLLVLIVAVLLFTLRSKLHNIDEFGINYNSFRTHNNIPELNPDWRINDKNALFEYYAEDLDNNGHVQKFVNLSKSDVGSERDIFKMDSIIILSLYERNYNNKVIYKIRSSELSKVFQSKKDVITSKEANTIFEKSNIEFRFNTSWEKE